MKIKEITINELETERLILVPFTIDICENMLYNDFNMLYEKGFVKSKDWPDKDMMDTVPKIIQKLLIHNYVTGFESWMIIRKDTKEIIGDVGFKGYNAEEQSVDIGYGIIRKERRKGFAEEACRGLIKWAFSQGIVKEITAKSFSDNVKSINLLKKLGFEKIFEYKEFVYWSLIQS
ncbi:GNAT family N-acetyltransferase [Empedobacter brevis]|uniref:N-acetyltransferase n=2 Tax=Empedobacter brevis TaxID=247 RepID=A0A511NDH6_9FLAO|nr:GNAT family N-acetyltransferase [Empedobacter brevis]MDM1071028.1 GNAT family N-acetyltransferase [Empedobacter brevis]QES93399.1 GNAT family N-acetyltransferase [Empedobacter brevis]GEM50381.1 N-acetyltransferase [Empedobacter brevis NBRC 14943 = ATCC 43319]